MTSTLATSMNAPAVRLPDLLTATCTLAQAEQLLYYDHHRVQVQGRWGVMLTHHWMMDPGRLDPLLVHVRLGFGREYGLTEAEISAAIQRHPPAPMAILTLVGQLDFQKPA